LTPALLGLPFIAMEILTGRLRLRCLLPTDAGDLVAHLNDWEVARWLARPPYPYSAADADEFIAFARACHAKPHSLLFAIADRGTDRLMGVVGIEMEPDGAGELGYWLGRPYWGRGYGQEATIVLIAQAGLAGLTQLVAFVHPENRRSLGLLQGCGFEPSGTALRPGRDGDLLMRRLVLRPRSPDAVAETAAAAASGASSA
jgi:8-oxo-dGTP diphosphatase